MNLTGLSDWGTQWMFVDLMKQARPWITQDAVTSPSLWDTKVSDTMPADEDGYPLQVPFTVPGTSAPQQVATIIGNDGYPPGEYTFLADGDGDILFNGTGITYKKLSTPISGSSISYTVTLANPHSYVVMTVKRSSATDHLRNMRFILPGFLSTYQSQPFHPSFLSHLKGAQLFRYMDYLATNYSPVVPGMLPTRATTYSQATPFGGSPDYIVALSNATKTDPWVNIPHAADDAWVRNLATTLYSGLNSDRKVYVEYSNELWNYKFTQAAWLGQTACNTPATYVYNASKNDYGVAGCDGVESSRVYHAQRLAQIYAIFAEVWGADFGPRVVTLAAGQAANAATSDKLLALLENPAINPNGYKADALAIAPYFGGSIANSINAAGKSAEVTVDDILTYAQNSMVGSSFPWMQACKQVATAHNVALVAYEGGQHLVGTDGVENDEVLTPKLIAANRSPTMQSLYEQYYNYWFKTIEGGVFAVFSNVCQPGKWGSWCVFEYQNQTLADAPKARALKNVMGL